jgi:hypothetical protein
LSAKVVSFLFPLIFTDSPLPVIRFLTITCTSAEFGAVHKIDKRNIPADAIKIHDISFYVQTHQTFLPAFTGKLLCANSALTEDHNDRETYCLINNKQKKDSLKNTAQ